ELLAWLADKGVQPGSVYLCHVDKRPDLALHTELAEEGALLGYDTFLRPHYQPELNVWPLLRGMVAAGLGSSVAVGLDLAPAAMWRGAQGGPAELVSSVAARLEAELDDDLTVSGLLGANVMQRLVPAPATGIALTSAAPSGVEA